MPDTTGPWWVQDSETGHKFVTYTVGEHLTVLNESPFTAGGELRPAEPSDSEKSSARTRKEASK